MPRGQKEPKMKRVAAAAMVEAGISSREAGKALGVSHNSVLGWLNDPTLQPEIVAKVKERIQDRLVVASDRFLSQSLDRIQELSPYQAMLCAGISHDHYLRSQQSSRSTGAQSITNILIQIDASLRATTTSSMPPGDVDAT
jgi:hypothetical protein